MKFPEVTLGVKDVKGLPLVKPFKVGTVEVDLSGYDDQIVNDSLGNRAFRALWGKHTPSIGVHERLYAIVMDSNSKPLAGMLLSVGGARQMHLHTGLLTTFALVTPKATAVLLCHNHPSGNLTPSDADKALNIRVKTALETVGVAFVDHLIINEEGSWLSMVHDGFI